MRYLSEDEAMRMSGASQLGEVVQGSDGHALRVGRRRSMASAILWASGRGSGGSRVRSCSERCPLREKIAPFVPGGAAALTAATPILDRPAWPGYGGLGGTLQAPDGTVYQMQGVSAEDELNGFLADEELQGLEADEELRGLDDDDELRGLSRTRRGLKKRGS